MKHWCEHTSFYNVLLFTVVITNSRLQMFVKYFLFKHEMYYTCYQLTDNHYIVTMSHMSNNMTLHTFYIASSICGACSETLIPLYLHIFSLILRIQCHFNFTFCSSCAQNVTEFEEW